jgi:hypothetical protein
MPTAGRTAEMRLRYLEMLVTGMTTDAGALPGPPPSGAESTWRWHPRT